MNKTLSFSNGITLELLLGEGEFLGIGCVRYRETELRSPQLPWTLYTESETTDRAVRFETFTLENVHQTETEAVLTLRSKGRWMPRLQEADAMGEARVRSRRVATPDAIFHWRFRAITEAVHETLWHGLAMQIEYQSDEFPIHWLMETATWEIGGKAAGCTLIQQDVSTIQPEQEVSEDSAFSTVEKFFTEGWGGSYPMDMMPRAAGASICDFQSKEETALCLFAERPGHTRARLEKYADENVIHHLDRVYFPLGKKIQTPERKFWVHRAAAPLQRHEVRNLWLDCFTEVRDRILDNYGFELEIPEPSCGSPLWDDHLKERMAQWADPLEGDLPEYARLGYRQVFLHGVWDSITSDPHPPAAGNMCCPYTFRFAESFGGPDRMRQLNATAEDNGLRLMQWFSFHLSRYAKVWKDHPDWLLREAGGKPWDGSYPGLWSGRMRSEYAKDFKDQIDAVMDDTGISGIFWDSYHNLGVVAVDWSAPDKAPQADEIFLMQAELQRKGFRQWVEASTIFGVGRVGVFGFENNKFRRRLWQDCLDGDQAFTLLDSSPAFFLDEGEPLLTEDRLSPERYFWLAAHRVLPGLASDPWNVGGERFPGGERAEEYARVNHLYNDMLPHMHRLRVQPGGTHVLWLDQQDEPSVIWAFSDVDFAFEGTLTDVESEEKLPANGRVALRKGTVYLLTPKPLPTRPKALPEIASPLTSLPRELV